MTEMVKQLEIIKGKSVRKMLGQQTLKDKIEKHHEILKDIN